MWNQTFCIYLKLFLNYIPLSLFLHELKSSGLTGELYFDADGYNGNTEHEVLSLRPIDNSTNFIPVGSWNQATGLRVDMEVFRYSARGFNNVTFVIGTKEVSNGSGKE